MPRLTTQQQREAEQMRRQNQIMVVAKASPQSRSLLVELFDKEIQAADAAMAMTAESGFIDNKLKAFAEARIHLDRAAALANRILNLPAIILPPGPSQTIDDFIKAMNSGDGQRRDVCIDPENGRFDVDDSHGPNQEA